MGAGIAKSERMSLAITANDEGNFKQCRFVQLITMNLVRGQSAIPEPGKHQSVSGLALRKVEFGHGKTI